MSAEAYDFTDPHLPDDLRTALRDALAAPPQRVKRLSGGGEVLWLKRVEELSLRWRLQKGDSRRAFEADRRALHLAGDLGLPVPAIRAEGRDFFALEEVGTPVADFLYTSAPAAELAPMLVAAGRALGKFHAAGVVHGRPKLRDICWDGTEARLIDFERFRAGATGPRRMARDMLLLLHSLFTQRPGGTEEASFALQGWLQTAPPALAQALKAEAESLRWLGALARVVLRLRPRSKETAAMPVTLDWIRKTLP